MRYGLDKPIKLEQPQHCFWCNNSLQRLRNVYKGRDSERWYCSSEHLSQGEERALRYRAALAGTVSSHYLIGAALLIAFMLAFTFSGGSRAWAHDPLTHQADSLADARSEAFGQCCDGTDYHRVETWETTATGYRVMYKGQWLEGSRRVKVNNMDNPDGEAKVWIYGEPDTPYIRCFMQGARS